MDMRPPDPVLLQLLAGAAELAALAWWTRRVDTAERLRTANLAGALCLGACMMAATLWNDGDWLKGFLAALAVNVALILAHTRVVYYASRRLGTTEFTAAEDTRLRVKLLGAYLGMMGFQLGLIVAGVVVAVRFAQDRGWDSVYVYGFAGAVSLALYAAGIVAADAAWIRVVLHLNKGVLVDPEEASPDRRWRRLWTQFLDYSLSAAAAAILILAVCDLRQDFSHAYGLYFFIVLYLGAVFRGRLPRPVRRVAAAIAAAAVGLALWRDATVVLPVFRLNRAVIAGDAAVAGALAAAGADPHHPDATLNGIEPVFSAIFAPQPAALRALLLAGADANRPDAKHLHSPLAMAASMGDEEVVQILLDAGARVDDPGRSTISPLGIASYKGHTGAARRLIASGASVRGRPNMAQPLMQAAKHDQPRMVRLLLDAGAPVGQGNGRGATALHAAAGAGALRSAEALLAAGADPEARDGAGRTPRDYAARARENRDAMIALLKRPTRRGRP